MLSVANKPCMLNVPLLSVIILMIVESSSYIPCLGWGEAGGGVPVERVFENPKSPMFLFVCL